MQKRHIFLTDTTLTTLTHTNKKDYPPSPRTGHHGDDRHAPSPPSSSHRTPPRRTMPATDRDHPADRGGRGVVALVGWRVRSDHRRFARVSTMVVTWFLFLFFVVEFFGCFGIGE